MLILTIAFLTESAGAGYALRPMTTVTSKCSKNISKRFDPNPVSEKGEAMALIRKKFGNDLKNILIFTPSPFIGDEIIYNAPVASQILATYPDARVTIATINPFIWEEGSGFFPFPMPRLYGTWLLDGDEIAADYIKSIREKNTPHLKEGGKFDLVITQPCCQSFVQDLSIQSPIIYKRASKDSFYYEDMKLHNKSRLPLIGYPQPYLFIKPEGNISAMARSKLYNIGITERDKFIYINTFSSDKPRSISPENCIVMTLRIAKIAREIDIKIALTFESVFLKKNVDRDSLEMEYSQLREYLYRESNGCIFLLPPISLSEENQKLMKYWIYFSSLVISANTGTAHLSYGMGKSTVVIMATSYDRKHWYPKKAPELIFIGQCKPSNDSLIIMDNDVLGALEKKVAYILNKMNLMPKTPLFIGQNLLSATGYTVMEALASAA